jgi:hypothetical protein
MTREELTAEFSLHSVRVALRGRCRTDWKKLEGRWRLRPWVVAKHWHNEIFDAQSIRASIKR